MLNTSDPTPSDDMAAYSCVSTSRISNYENTVLARIKAPPVPVVKDVGGANLKLHPHLIIAEDGDLDKDCLAGVQSVGKVSTYENVCPPGEREMLPIPAAVGVASGFSQVPKKIAEKRSVYENVDLRPHPTPDTGPAHNSSHPRPPAQQRRNVYEEVEIGGRKVNGQGRHGNYCNNDLMC